VVRVAAELGLPAPAVAAVGIRFDAEGGYAGWDDASPLARAGGKAEVIRGWALPGPVLLVGDGATDLEARPAVDAFAAFMGVVDRPAVAAAADYVLRAPDLRALLAIVLP
jgi:phosphoserine phosphatase